MNVVNKGLYGRTRSMRRMLILLGITLGIVGSVNSHAFEDNMHLGVASCASNVCHGKLSKQTDENVWLNEYGEWSSVNDRHSRAYKTLLSDESKLIARKLGLKNAQSANLCLDCHADNVPQELRDTKFQVTDGVGCEACHGGAKLWIDSHTEPGATHADNLKLGMYPTEDPGKRATMCLGCHMGTKSKFTTHEIMGAGHPRLRFELETFTALQPAHYDVDADYIERKRSIIGFGLWMTGQIEAADNYLGLLQSSLLEAPGMFPEFSFYDCHSCHHPMDNKRWTMDKKNQGLKAGTLRLQDQHFLMLRTITQVLDAPRSAEFRRLSGALLKAGQTSNQAIKKASAELSSWLRARQAEWASRETSKAEIKAIRKAIVTLSANGTISDFSSAEQAFMGIESLSLYLGDVDQFGAALDRLFALVESDKTFTPKAFRSAAQQALNAL